MTVGRLATATLAQQHDGLVLTSGQQAPVGRLGHAVNVRRGVLSPAALEHVHHLGQEDIHTERRRVRNRRP